MLIQRKPFAASGHNVLCRNKLHVHRFACLELIMKPNCMLCIVAWFDRNRRDRWQTSWTLHCMEASKMIAAQCINVCIHVRALVCKHVVWSRLRDTFTPSHPEQLAIESFQNQLSHSVACHFSRKGFSFLWSSPLWDETHRQWQCSQYSWNGGSIASTFNFNDRKSSMTLLVITVYAHIDRTIPCMHAQLT